MALFTSSEDKKTPKGSKKNLHTLLDEADKNIPANPGVYISENDKKAFEKLYTDSLKNQNFKQGQVVKGKIVGVKNDFVIVDINYKSEGIISKSEFRLLDDQEIEIGQEVDVYIDQIENDSGMIVLSKDKADINKAWKDIIKATEANQTIQGRVIAQVKGGLSVDIGVRAFLPGSQLDVRPVKNMKAYIGQTYDFKVIKVSQKRGNIVLSRRVVLEKERGNLPTSKDIQVGSVVKGLVKNITEYGAFIDLGETDGLLHITDISWSRLKHPSDILKLNQEVEVKVLKIDAEKNRVSLGMKQLDEEQWSKQAKDYPLGAITKGEVVSFAEYGAFVALDNGLEGLVHINEISWTKKVKNPAHILKQGQKVDVKVIELQPDLYRLNLSIKQAQDNPWDYLTDKYKVGDVLSGSVTSIIDFGIFVTVGKDIDGLVHVSDISWKDNVKPSERFNVGDEVQVKILDINPKDEKLSLGMKQLTDNPWSQVENKYPIGSSHKVEVVRMVDFGVFVRLEQDIEGLIHISELSKDRVNTPSDIVKVGDVVEAEIITIDVDSRKIGLSMRLVPTQHSSESGSQESNKGFMGNVFAKVLKASFDQKEGREKKDDEEKQ